MKKVPARICVVCRSKSEKYHLSRLIYTSSGLQVDLSGKMNGRGAYLCQSGECWEYAMKTNILGKVLNATLTRQDYERLAQAKPSS